jgi:hypothetical protein
MYLKTAIVAGSMLVAASAFAQSNTDMRNSSTPGHQMQEKGSVKGSPGASGYAPGHTKENTGSGSNTLSTPDKPTGNYNGVRGSAESGAGGGSAK